MCSSYKLQVPNNITNSKTFVSSTYLTSFSSANHSRKTNKWDVFREASEDNVTSSDVEFWKTVNRVTKVIFAAILFIFVLGTAVLSKSTLFLLIANIFPPNEMRNSSLKTANGHFHYQSTGNHSNTNNYNIPSCLHVYIKTVFT